MRRRGLGPLEARWPVTGDFMDLARSWNRDASECILDLVWRAYDLLRHEVLNKYELGTPVENLEREFTQLLEQRIGRVMSGFEPFRPQHGAYETETRAPAPAQPPEYDIAFVWNANPRLMWPLEAKVLPGDNAVAEYLLELEANYLTCRYAPFSSEAAMLGYLLRGDAGAALSAIGHVVAIQPHPGFPGRPQGFSEHGRLVPAGKTWISAFRCHHLILSMN